MKTNPSLEKIEAPTTTQVRLSAPLSLDAGTNFVRRCRWRFHRVSHAQMHICNTSCWERRSGLLRSGSEERDRSSRGTARQPTP